MIQPLRTLHRRIFYVATVVTPMVFFAGLASRAPQLSLESPAAAPKQDFAKWNSGLLASKSNSGSVTVQILQPLKVPDPLLFCSSARTGSNSLSDDAALLGSVNNGAVLGPCRKAQLVLYSLGHRTVVDQLALEAGR